MMTPDVVARIFFDVDDKSRLGLLLVVTEAGLVAGAVFPGFAIAHGIKANCKLNIVHSNAVKFRTAILHSPQEGSAWGVCDARANGHGNGCLSEAVIRKRGRTPLDTNLLMLFPTWQLEKGVPSGKFCRIIESLLSELLCSTVEIRHKPLPTFLIVLLPDRRFFGELSQSKYQ